MDLNSILSKVTKAATYRKEITVNGVKYGLLLPGSEVDRRVTKTQEVMTRAKTDEDRANGYDLLKRATIGAFLESIDGEVLPETVPGEGDETDDRFTYLMEASGKWPQALTDVIYSACQDLRSESRKDMYGKVQATWYDKPLYERLLEDEEALDKDLAGQAQESSDKATEGTDAGEVRPETQAEATGGKKGK